MSRHYLMLSSDSRFRADLEHHVQDVARLAGLAEYDVRQRLTRPGLSLLATLDTERADRAASALSEAGYQAAVVSREQLSGVSRPERVLAVRALPGRVELLGAGDEVLGILNSESDALLVAGDLDADPLSLTRARQRLWDPAVALKTLSRGFPALRLFLRGEQRSYVILGRRFNYTSLGALTTVSAALNFEALVQCLQGAAGALRLDVDFRLSDLPPARRQLVLDEEHPGLDDFELHATLTRAIWGEGALNEPGAVPDHEEPDGAGFEESAAAVSRVLGDPERRRTRLLERLKLLGPWWLHVGLLVGWLGAVALLMPVSEQALLGSFFAFASAIALRVGVIQLLRRREIEDYPTSRARSVAMGKVEVCGRAVAAVPMRAPWSGVECVWYRWLQLERVTTADGKQLGRTAGRGDSGELPFLIEDTSGRVLVDPAGAELVLDSRATIQGSYISVLRGVPTAIPMGPDTKVIEETVPVGRALYVLGTARPVRRGGEGRAALSGRLRELKADPAQLRGFDVNRDGHIDPQEWEAAVASVEQALLAERLSEGGEERYGGVIGRGAEGSLFLISDRSEQALVRGIAIRAWASLAVGLAALGFGVWGMLSF